MSNSEHLSLFRSYLPCPNSELFIVCFVRFLICQGGFFLNFIIFFNRLTNRFDWFIRAIRIQHYFFWVILVSTPPCFDHISLIRTWNGAPFFYWSPYSSRNIISKFHNFPQPDGLVGSWFNRLVGLAYVERCFL